LTLASNFPVGVTPEVGQATFLYIGRRTGAGSGGDRQGGLGVRRVELELIGARQADIAIARGEQAFIEKMRSCIESGFADAPRIKQVDTIQGGVREHDAVLCVQIGQIDKINPGVVVYHKTRGGRKLE
jgi:hypothetical protein